ncbi:MAG: hypothetical protein KF858_12895 [Candidatus Sumerlaeia bacterium]|nr:hypothetical protein [Candidatus Sumerlaeia bacterium]
MSGSQGSGILRAWSALRHLPGVRAWLAGWGMVIVLVAAGVALLRPLPNTLEARGIRVGVETLTEMRPSRLPNLEFPGGSTLPPDATRTILFESTIRTVQGPPNRPWELMRYRNVEQGDGVHLVEATLVEMGSWGRGTPNSEGHFRQLLLNKPLAYEVNSRTGAVIGAQVPEGDVWIASLALQALVLEPSGLLPARVLQRGDRWMRESVGRVAGTTDARFDVRGEFTFEGFVNWRGVDLAHVRGEIGGTAGGVFLPDVVDEPDGTGTHLVARRIESVAHYFFDPETGALVGGFHLSSPVSEVTARVERESAGGTLVEMPRTRRDYDVQTSFTVVDEQRFLQRR